QLRLRHRLLVAEQLQREQAAKRLRLRHRELEEHQGLDRRWGELLQRVEHGARHLGRELERQQAVAPKRTLDRRSLGEEADGNSRVLRVPAPVAVRYPEGNGDWHQRW